MHENNPSPCKTCTRVKNPDACGSIACQDWHDWFVEAWDNNCGYLREKLAVETPGENEKEVEQ